MLSLDLGRGSSGSTCNDTKIDRLRAVSTGLTLGLETSTSGWMRSGGGVVSGMRPSCREEDSRALDLLPRGPALMRQTVSATGSVPPASCISQLTRQSLFVTTSSGANQAAAIDCEEIAAPENHSSSRGGSPGPRGIDMNEIPVDADVSSPRSCSISPPNGAFAFDIARKGESSSVNIKRERERLSDAEADRTNCEVSSRGSDEEDGGPRKKLRLSKEQAAVLEESFKEHSTLNPKQKNALAKQLGLRPRQVEVWFQNRRARTKLKQTEIDCELLKRCCETLTEENRRLQKEVQELRAIKVPPPCVISQDFYMPLPAATLTMCPSCERLAPVDNRSGHLPPPFVTKAHHPATGFSAHFPPQPPAACQS